MGNTTSHSPSHSHSNRGNSSLPPTPSTATSLTHPAPLLHPQVPLPPLDSTFIDSGYLLPLSNIYPASAQDWLHPVVQRHILARKLAPFYRGLEEWEEEWGVGEVVGELEKGRKMRGEAVRDLEAKEKMEKEDAERAGAGRKAGKSKEGATIDARGKREAAKAVVWPVRHEEAERYVGETAECPLCFLYYPPNINMSRCCQQPICTECFVQIKRPDPTPQELKSEPVCCPYCVETNFGVIYEPPAPGRRTDWQSPLPIPSNIPTYSPTSLDPSPSTPPHPSTTPPSPPPLPLTSTSLPLLPLSLHPLPPPPRQVVTTDAIQMDWEAKLEAVKATVQRRANRRIIFRQEGDRLVPVGVTSSRDPTGSALMAALEAAGRNTSSISSSISSGDQEGGSTTGRRSRRTREGAPGYGMDLEELMIMEAMRLSMVEEEERQKKEKVEREKAEKEAKKAAKRESKGGVKGGGKSPEGAGTPTSPVASTSSGLPLTNKELPSIAPVGGSPILSHVQPHLAPAHVETSGTGKSLPARPSLTASTSSGESSSVLPTSLPSARSPSPASTTTNSTNSLLSHQPSLSGSQTFPGIQRIDSSASSEYGGTAGASVEMGGVGSVEDLGEYQRLVGGDADVVDEGDGDGDDAASISTLGGRSTVTRRSVLDSGRAVTLLDE